MSLAGWLVACHQQKNPSVFRDGLFSSGAAEHSKDEKSPWNSVCKEDTDVHRVENDDQNTIYVGPKLLFCCFVLLCVVFWWKVEIVSLLWWDSC